MPDRLSFHTPVLVNTIGHFAGAVAFGILLYLLVIDWRRNPRERGSLPSIAAALALLWNLGSLVGLATAPQGGEISDTIVAASFSVLSLLPAVLMHISLGPRRPVLWVTGYAVSGLAIALHISDLVTAAPRFHYAGLLLITIGFGALTAFSVIRETVAGGEKSSGARLAGAMVLFLFAISFVHFGAAHDGRAWSGEAILHHAGIPLALFVLLQDYRFLLLDAFIRFLVNGLLAALTAWAALEVEARFGILAHAAREPFYFGLAFSLACLGLSLFAWTRAWAQRVLTRAVFLRMHWDHAVSQLRDLTQTNPAEPEYLAAAAKLMAAFLSAREVAIEPGAGNNDAGRRANTVVDPERWNLPGWVQALVPLRFSRGDVQLLLLGSRFGGRRYLSEDLEILERFAAIICEQVERIRNSEMQLLVTQAELRSLQAQINPHFLFNALNTLYGTIARENSAARHLVSNLASLFRYSFAVNRGMIRVEEELTIVRAYLEIEELRLAGKLVTEIDVEESVLRAEVPVLSIQPLVENAVKHGAAAKPGGGFVRLSIRNTDGLVKVEICNNGEFCEPSPGHEPKGVGLANVRRRLTLCYGSSATVQTFSANDVTIVSFSVPAQVGAQGAPAVAHV
jgi:two-component system LytT family sensor kinase